MFFTGILTLIQEYYIFLTSIEAVSISEMKRDTDGTDELLFFKLLKKIILNQNNLKKKDQKFNTKSAYKPALKIKLGQSNKAHRRLSIIAESFRSHSTSTNFRCSKCSFDEWFQEYKLSSKFSPEANEKRLSWVLSLFHKLTLTIRLRASANYLLLTSANN